MAIKTQTKKKMIWPAILAGVLAIVWIAYDMKYISCPFNPGPFAVLAVALALLIREYN